MMIGALNFVILIVVIISTIIMMTIMGARDDAQSVAASRGQLLKNANVLITMN